MPPSEHQPSNPHDVGGEADNNDQGAPGCPIGVPAPGDVEGEADIAEFSDAEERALGTAVSIEVAPGTGRRIAFGAIAIALLLSLGFGIVRFSRNGEEHGVAKAAELAAAASPMVDVVAAKPVGTSRPLSLPGQTAAWYESTIYARVNGYVAKWLVDIGDPVKKGQVLARIETPELDAQLEAAQAQLKAARAQVLVRQAEVDFARTTNARWGDSPKGVVSDQEREAKRADYESAQARLNAADAQVALDQAQVDQYAALSQFKQVTAPFDGVITERHIDIGNLVTAGSTTSTTPLYKLTQNDPIRVFVDAPQSAAADLRNAGVPAEIRDPAGRTIQGKVTRAAQALNAQARTLRVEIDIPNSNQELVPGMYVKVDFGLPAKGLVEVPAATLIFRDSGPEVARVDAQGKVSFRKVSIASDDGNVVELGAGVEPGDRLALNISSRIGDGDTVQVNVAETGAGTPPVAKR